MHRGPRSASARGPAHLYCAACGHDWIELDAAAVALAWYALGAWHGAVRANAAAIEVMERAEREPAR